MGCATITTITITITTITITTTTTNTTTINIITVADRPPPAPDRWAEGAWLAEAARQRRCRLTERDRVVARLMKELD